jgi:hemerythrin
MIWRIAMMKAIEWNESLSLGVKEVDDEHKRLIGYYNSFFAACFACQGSEVVAETLNQLLQYTKDHFQHEEALMEREGYPGLGDQKNEHANLLQTVLEFQKKLASEGSDTVRSDTLVFLNQWLTTHLMESDAALARFLRGAR